MGKILRFPVNAEESFATKGEVDRMKQLIKSIVYILNNCGSKVYKAKLNKLLFYLQYHYYKEKGVKFFDYNFYYEYYGPVLEELDQNLVALEEVDIIDIESDEYGTYLRSKIILDQSQYTQEELEELKMIVKKYGDWSTSRLSEYSHKEPFWKKYQKGTLISLENAVAIKDV